MTKTASLHILLFIFICVPASVYAQLITGVQLEQTGNTLAIHFNLEGENGQHYSISPVVMLRSGNNLIPEHVTGDLITGAGNNRVIFWTVLEDRPLLKEEIAVKLTAQKVNTPTTRQAPAVGGVPSNALLSMILPGLGDVFVNDPGKEVAVKPLYIMAGYSAGVLLALYSKNQATENYRGYQNAVQQYEMNNYYEQAAYYRDNQHFYTMLAATIWISDVVRVYIKGRQNNKAWSSFATNFDVNSNVIAGQPSIKLTYRF